MAGVKASDSLLIRNTFENRAVGQRWKTCRPALFCHTKMNRPYFYRANTLHYVMNNQKIDDGSLVLVDAGAYYHGYVSDVTRTWPINGR